MIRFISPIKLCFHFDIVTDADSYKQICKNDPCLPSWILKDGINAAPTLDMDIIMTYFNEVWRHQGKSTKE